MELPLCSGLFFCSGSKLRLFYYNWKINLQQIMAHQNQHIVKNYKQQILSHLAAIFLLRLLHWLPIVSNWLNVVIYLLHMAQSLAIQCEYDMKWDQVKVAKYWQNYNHQHSERWNESETTKIQISDYFFFVYVFFYDFISDLTICQRFLFAVSY